MSPCLYCRICSFKQFKETPSCLTLRTLLRKKPLWTMCWKCFEYVVFSHYGSISWVKETAVRQGSRKTFEYPATGICYERNWPCQYGVPQICLQLDEQSNSFSQQYYYCHCQIAMHISSVHWWINGRVCYMYRNM